MAQNVFCPRCATALSPRLDGGRERPACPDLSCGYIDYGAFSLGCSGVVLREESGITKALLIQRGQEPFAGMWQLPGGYAEHDESLTLAVEREVLEEAGITATVCDAIGFRHMSGGAVNNVYMIFRLDYESGEPRFDGEETADARFCSLEEMAQMQGVQNITRWGIEQALATAPGSGLSREPAGEMRRGWQVFGLTDVDPHVWERR
jgi:ADP-ribose pyrophosphatase YjhB (NUDIX family)